MYYAERGDLLKGLNPEGALNMTPRLNQSD